MGENRAETVEPPPTPELSLEEAAEEVTRGALPILLAGASIVIILAGMKAAAGIVNPILLSLIVAVAVAPLPGWLARRGVPRWAGVPAVGAGLVVVGGVLVVILAASLSELDSKLPVYEQNLDTLLRDIDDRLTELGVETSTIQISSVITGSAVAEASRTVLNAVVGALSNVFIMTFVVILMLIESGSFHRKVMPLAGTSRFFEGTQVALADIRSYIFIKVWLGLLQAALVGGIYFALGTDFALLWAVVFLFLSFIPNVGFILALAPPAALTLLEHGVGRALVLLATVGVVNAIVDNGLGPRFIGRGLDLSPLVVFLSLLLWGFVLGPVGALLSVLLTILVRRLVLEQFEETRGVARLMGAAVR